MVPPLARMGKQIIQVRLDNILDIMKRKGHFPLKGRSGIFQIEGNFLIREGTPRTNKIHFMPVLWLDLDLIIPEKYIHKRKYFATHVSINDIINAGCGVVVLGTHFI